MRRESNPGSSDFPSIAHGVVLILIVLPGLEDRPRVMIPTSRHPAVEPPKEPRCDYSYKFRRQQQLEDLFKDDPNGVFTIQSVYVTTREYGVVTVVRRKALDAFEPDTYAIGMNITNQAWPSLKYVFDNDLMPGSLSLVNAAGKVSAIVPYTRIPAALDLLEAVVASVRRTPTSRSFYIPAEPNLGYCDFRQSL